MTTRLVNTNLLHLRKVAAISPYLCLAPLHIGQVLLINHKKEHTVFLREFKKVEQKGKVIELNKKDVRKYFNAGSSKGGQKANRTRSHCHLIHEPTKIESKGTSSRQASENLEYAMAKLRMLVDIETHGDRSVFRIIEREKQEKMESDRQRKQELKERRAENEAKLQELLKIEDTLIY